MHGKILLARSTTTVYRVTQTFGIKTCGGGATERGKTFQKYHRESDIIDKQ